MQTIVAGRIFLPGSLPEKRQSRGFANSDDSIIPYAILETYAKLRLNEKRRCDERIQIFIWDPFDSVLHNHALGGKWSGYRSINIGGDLRAIYEPIDAEMAFFVRLGTHSELFGR